MNRTSRPFARQLSMTFNLSDAMRNVFVILAAVLCLTFASSCSSHSDLYEQTDYFIEQLSSTYQSYGLQGASEKRYTKDGKYGVFPIGRLVNVRIEEYATQDEYESLRKDIDRHYKKDRRVNQVYINQAGTIMIDCRN